MKKNVLIMILAATLALSSCADQPPIQATTASWQVGSVDSQTEASTTSEAQIPVTETTTADTTTVNAAIPEGENIHPFSARTDLSDYASGKDVPRRREKDRHDRFSRGYRGGGTHRMAIPLHRTNGFSLRAQNGSEDGWISLSLRL